MLLRTMPTACAMRSRICKGKCSFIRADFHLNDAFQLNSLTLLTPPQNASVIEQGVWEPSILLTERGKARKRHAICLTLTSSLRHPSHLWGFLPSVPFTCGLQREWVLQPSQRGTETWTHKQDQVLGKGNHGVCLFPGPLTSHEFAIVIATYVRRSYRSELQTHGLWSVVLTHLEGSLAGLQSLRVKWHLATGQGKLMPCKSRVSR